MKSWPDGSLTVAQIQMPQTRLGITPLSKALISALFDLIALLFDRDGSHSIRQGQTFHHAIIVTHHDRLQDLEYLLSKGAENQLEIKFYDSSTLFEREAS